MLMSVNIQGKKRVVLATSLHHREGKKINVGIWQVR